MGGCDDCRRKRRAQPEATQPILVRVEHAPPITVGGLIFALTAGAAGVIGAKMAMRALLEPVS